jgi:hypothetical protein
MNSTVCAFHNRRIAAIPQDKHDFGGGRRPPLFDLRVSLEKQSETLLDCKRTVGNWEKRANSRMPRC